MIVAAGHEEAVTNALAEGRFAQYRELLQLILRRTDSGSDDQEIAPEKLAVIDPSLRVIDAFRRRFDQIRSEIDATRALIEPRRRAPGDQ